MKGIPIQLQGVISFINTTLQNKTLSQTFQCYLLNLEKATLDTLKLANIAFENLDNHVPFDIRMMFQKTTNKIKEFIKHKPKGQLERQQKYHHEYDEVQHFLQNRPDLQRSNVDQRGQLFKFLSEVEEKQKQNKLLLQNIPKFSYGISRNYTRQHKTYFSDINMNNSSQINKGRLRGSQVLQNSYKNQSEQQSLKKIDKNNAEKNKKINQMIQTDLNLVLLNQIMSNINKTNLSAQLLQIINNSLSSRNYKNNQPNTGEQAQELDGSHYINKDLHLNLRQSEPNKEQNKVQTQIQQENNQAQAKIKQQLANIQDLQLQKVEIKNQEVLVKGFIKKKKELKSKKNENIKRDSVFKKNKNGDQMQTSRQKKKYAPRQSIDKPEKILQKLNKAISKQNLANQTLKTNFRPSETVPKQQTKLQKSSKIQAATQTQENFQIQMKKFDSTDLIKSNKDIFSNNIVNKQKKGSGSLQKLNELKKLQKQNYKGPKQTENSTEFIDNNLQKQIISKKEVPVNKINDNIDISDQYADKNKITQIAHQQLFNENSTNSDYNVVNSIKEESEIIFPHIQNTNKYQILTNSISNFSLTNLKQKGELKHLKKTKSNFSQINQSIHLNLSQYKAQKYNPLQKKDLQRSLENLPAIRQEQQNQIYKKREKLLSKGKAEHIKIQNKRLLDQIQQGVSQKKGRNIEWIKVIRDIREYEHLHFGYCGENCVHLNKFYQFLKKKNLSMYINRKQLYVHKHNIEIKPVLL